MSILPTPGRELMKRHGMRAPRAARKQHASRLLRLHQMTAHAPRPRLLPPAPPQPDPTGGVDKTQAARDFHSWLRSEDGACGTPDQQCRIVVCLDNSAAIRAIRGSPSISSQAAAEKFAEAAARHGDVRTRWCPGHTGIAGNERADQLAKEGCRALGPDRPPTYANIKRQAKAAARRDFQDWWAAGAPSSYKSLGLKASLGCPGAAHQTTAPPSPARCEERARGLRRLPRKV
ncbi:RNase H domain-containing protein [Hirsutella rhossiliensis]